MHFLDASMAGDTFLAGDYSVPLVLLSLLIAIMAAFASISHVDLMRATRSARARLGWHLNGALALGLGVWTMHFTGMVAFRLPVAIEYHALLTLVSVFPAVLAAYLALDVISRPRPSFRAILLGGALMGLGIGGMHYIGMAAMVMEAAMAYRPGLVLLSLLVAVVMSSLALAIPRVMGKFLQEHQLYQPLGFKLASATLMGLAISSLHYVAMAATRFPAGHSHEVALPGPTLNPDLVASLAVGSSLFILITSTVTASLRQRVELARLEAESARLQALELDERFTKIASRLPGVVYQFRMAPMASCPSLMPARPSGISTGSPLKRSERTPTPLPGLFIRMTLKGCCSPSRNRQKQCPPGDTSTESYTRSMANAGSRVMPCRKRPLMVP